MNNIPLTDETLLLYAAANYDNPHCFDTEEFMEDLNRFKYLKRLFNRYQDNGDLKDRLILNHIIILYNVFSVSATPMLFLKLKGQYHLLKPFLVLINRMPDKVEVCGEIIFGADIPMNSHIVDVLRKV